MQLHADDGARAIPRLSLRPAGTVVLARVNAALSELVLNGSGTLFADGRQTVR